MKTRLIFSQPGNHRLILIFAGWSTDFTFYRDLHAEGWDIAVVYDYSDLSFDPAPLERYSTIFLLAWSMGVAAASHAAATTLPASRISAAFAVNGTLHPSSDIYGIPEAIYEGTRATLNPRNLLKFSKRMGYEAPADMPELSAEEVYIPDFEKLAHELENMRTALKGALPWKRVYISEHDRIFPPENIKRAWECIEPSPQIISLDLPHYVHLQKIINEITPDIKKIAKRFGEALPTYDDNAEAQRPIVDHLFSMLSENDAADIHDVLEIGSGSGLLSRKLLNLPDIRSATFLDLYPLPHFDIIDNEHYIEADAEEWMINAPSDSYDLIASASTIQWFADPAGFFREARRVLRPGGILLCSTFLPGNLSELDVHRPARLLYRSEDELESFIKGFIQVKIQSEEIKIEFSSYRDLLRHLKLTGVAGGASSRLEYAAQSHASKSPSAQSGPYTLTYRPLYIFAK